ncbi:MAG: proteasome assembly chaperone family protein [Dehalococcoidia bacterium]
MHDAVHLLLEEQLHDPLLIAGFESQSGDTGAAAIRQLVRSWNARLIADIDPDEFFDFTVRRPTVRRQDGQTVIEWPSNRLYLARCGQRDVILLDGMEPSLRWNAFSKALTSLCATLGVSAVLMLDVQPGNVPHTRPRPLRLVGDAAGLRTLPALLRLESQPLTYEGPVGIAAVLAEQLHFEGIESGSLQVMVPAYIPGTADPQAALAFVAALDGALGTDTDVEALRAECAAFDQQLTLLMQGTPPLARTVAWLEQQFDWLKGTTASHPPSPSLPSPASAVADVERFLKAQRGQTEAEADSAV